MSGAMTPERMPTWDETGSAGNELVSSVEKLQRELMELLEPPTRQPALGKHSGTSLQRTPLRELNAGPRKPVRAESLNGSGRKPTLGALASYCSHRLSRGEPADGDDEVSIFKNAHRNRIHNRVLALDLFRLLSLTLPAARNKSRMLAHRARTRPASRRSSRRFLS
jgi:hypothetical protein